MVQTRTQGDAAPAPPANNDLVTVGGRTFRAEKLPSILREIYACLDRHFIAAQRRESEAVLALTRRKMIIRSRNETAVDSNTGGTTRDLELAVARAKGAREAMEQLKADVDAIFEAASVQATGDEKAEAEAVGNAIGQAH